MRHLGYGFWGFGISGRVFGVRKSRVWGPVESSWHSTSFTRLGGTDILRNVYCEYKMCDAASSELKFSRCTLHHTQQRK